MRAGTAQVALEGRPVVHDDICLDLLAPLANAIFARAREHPRTAPSLNVGGWKSGETFFGWPTPAVAELYQVISRGYLDGRVLVGWAMINWGGSHHPRHRHDGSIVSGVYYVNPGGAPTAPTIFEVPGSGEISVEPRPARLVLFPSRLWHRVPACGGHSPRVTIAFDVRR